MHSVVLGRVLLCCTVIATLFLGMVVVRAGQDVVLTWDPTPSFEPLHYFVYFGRGNGPTNRISTGQLTRGKLKNLLNGKKYFFFVTAANEAGEESVPSNLLSFTMPVQSVPKPNRAPVLNAIGTLTANAGQVLSVRLRASDPDVDNLTYSLVSGPAGAKVAAKTGVLTWRVPDQLDPWPQAVTVRVVDDGVPALSDTQNFSIIVQPSRVEQRDFPGATDTITCLTWALPTQLVTFSLPLSPPGQMYGLEVSEDLIHWTDLGIALSGDQFFDATEPTGHNCFYRVRPSSNPSHHRAPF